MHVKKLIFRLSSWLFMCMCTLGLLWQLISIVDEYFRYRVSSTTSVFTPEVIDPLSFTICVFFNSVLDFDRLNREVKTNFTQFDKRGVIAMDLSDDLLSVKHLFDYTPSKESILLEFFFKPKKSPQLTRVSENITNRVSIVKFLNRCYVCYQITVKEDEALRYREIAISSFNQFRVKRFIFPESFLNSTVVKVMLSLGTHIPYKELITTPYQKKPKIPCNHFISNHMIIEKTRLKYPHETYCVSYESLGLRDQHHCVEECVTAGVFKKLGKISLLSPVVEGTEGTQGDLRPFAYEHFKDENASAIFWQLQYSCESQQCHRSECHDKEVVTTTHSQLSFDYDKDKLHWDHHVFSQISFKIHSTASLPFVEFLIYILGSISTWTGLSIMACNPIHLGQKVYIVVLKMSKGRVNESSPKRKRVTKIRNLHKVFRKQPPVTPTVKSPPVTQMQSVWRFSVDV